MLSTYLIGLREGLEASLVVGILIAYLVRSGHADKVRNVWIGVGTAVGLSLAFSAVLNMTSNSLEDEHQEMFAGFMSLIAVGFVTWMVFWMKSAARGLKGELHGRMDKAVAAGGLALAVVAFVAVVREGLETALFLFSTAGSAGTGLLPLIGALLGIATAVALGWGIYRGALRLNLATFFTWTGVALIFIAAGVLAYAVHELQEAHILPGEDNLAFDISGTIPKDSAAASVIRGILNLRPAMSVLEVIAYFGYLIPVLVLYLRPNRTASQIARGQISRGQISRQQVSQSEQVDERV